MSDRLNKLIDERARAWAEAKDLGDVEDRNAEQEATYTRALDDVERLSEQIETEERAVRLAGVMDADDRGGSGDGGGTGTPVPGGDADPEDRGREYREAFGVYMREGMSGLTPEQRTSLQKGYDAELRAQASTPGSAGGYLIPTDMLNKMTEALKAFGGLLGEANVIPTASGNPLQWPTNDDTGNAGQIIGQNAQVQEDDLTFGQEELGAYIYTSNLVRVPWSLLQDEVFDLEGFLGRKLGERIARALAPHLVTGTGTNQPTGLFTGALASGVVAASATEVAFDELIDLEHSVDPAYRNSGNCRFVFNDQTLKGLRKVKDLDENYIWQPSVQAGVASTILGRPYTVDQGVADLALNSLSVGFGDVRTAFVVRRVAGGSLVVMRERYADFMQNGYFGFQRFDSVVDDARAFKTLKQAAA